jgi:hypothetical protein
MYLGLRTFNLKIDCSTAYSAAHPSITVTSPNGGETWKVGETHNITWNSSGYSAGNVSISLVENMGGVTAPCTYQITSLSSNPGSYNWVIPETITNTEPSMCGGTNLTGKQFKVRVSFDSVIDFSDNTFTIAVVSQTCEPSWSCASWGNCLNSQQTRTCTDSNNCGVTTNRPALTQACFIITASASAGGTISPLGGVSVSSGGSKTFTITPNASYNISRVVVDGVSKGAISSYTFANVTTGHTITAYFVLKPGRLLYDSDMDSQLASIAAAIVKLQEQLKQLLGQ